MREVKQMLWMVLGVLVGLAVGIVAVLEVMQLTGAKVADSPTLTVVVAIPLLLGGLLGGGYLAQWLVYRYTKAKRKKKQAERDKTRIGGKKKG